MILKVVTKKNIKRLKTQKRNYLNVDELNSYRVAYGQPLKAIDFIFYVGMPRLLFVGFSFILLYYWWLSLLMGVFGAIYGYKVFLPKSIEKSYKAQSFNQRNIFVN
ncbi:hypothetical protein ACFTY7_46100, partial [Streptomyces sp. NPDC057062]|uniref:hypothetical protein n=1 Tax=Streptomyces sp. NPDC057062 TaxID=3346011 RepID=UPI003628DFB2